jgi:hypothetical protein
VQHINELAALQIMLQYGSMATRMNEPAVRRPSLPLTDRDVADLDRIRSSPSDRAALGHLVPGRVPAEGSVAESVLLHAIFEAGLRAVRERAEEEGYRQLAAEYKAEDAERRARARRRPPHWAGDE